MISTLGDDWERRGIEPATGGGTLASGLFGVEMSDRGGEADSDCRSAGAGAGPTSVSTPDFAGGTLREVPRPHPAIPIASNAAKIRIVSPSNLRRRLSQQPVSTQISPPGTLPGRFLSLSLV